MYLMVLCIVFVKLFKIFPNVVLIGASAHLGYVCVTENTRTETESHEYNAQLYIC